MKMVWDVESTTVKQNLHTTKVIGSPMMIVVLVMKQDIEYVSNNIIHKKDLYNMLFYKHNHSIYFLASSLSFNTKVRDQAPKRGMNFSMIWKLPYQY